MSNNKFKVLVVEDEANICSFIYTLLETNGYQTFVAPSCELGQSMFGSCNPDLIILDLGLPDRDGVELIRYVRQKYLTPIIVLSARTTEADKIEALDLGANDYITKPFGTGELLARVRTAIRHARATVLTAEGMQTGQFRAGDLLIDYDKHRVYVGDRDVNLTQNEYKIVSLLGKYAGKVLTYDFIIKEIWGPNMQNDNRILRVNMANIRRKMENNPAQPRYIFTEVGVGYRIVDGD